jgi:glycosyltransferase involved in cell wall biosynthesis
VSAPKPLRLLTVTPRYLPETGGVEEHVRQVAGRLAARGLQVTVVTTDASGRLPPRERVHGIEVLRLRAWSLGSDLRFAPALYRVVARGLWDVVHVQSYHTLVAPLAMLSAARAGIPYVLTFHGGGHSSRLRHRLRPIQRRLLRPLLARAACLVALTTAEADGYARELGLESTRFTVIPNGFDLGSGWNGNAPLREPTPPTESPLIASIGRLERYKGHHRILGAMPKILDRRPDARLWIGGSGNFEPDLRRLAVSLGIDDRVDIRAVPPADRTAMAREIRAADLVVLLSEFETQPLAVLEAVSLGRPVLVADSPGLRELAEAGLARTVPLDAQPEHIADAVLDQLEHPDPPVPIDLPTWDQCAESLVSVYTDARGRR